MSSSEWTPAIRAELQTWFRTCQAEAGAHLSAYRWKTFWWQFTATLAALLSFGTTVIGLLSKNAVDEFTPAPWMTYFIIAAPASVGLFSTFQGTFNLSATPPKHEAAYKALTGLAEDIRGTLAVQPETRGAAAAYLAKVQERHQQILDGYPVVSVSQKALSRSMNLKCPEAEGGCELDVASDGAETDITLGVATSV